MMSNGMLNFEVFPHIPTRLLGILKPILHICNNFPFFKAQCVADHRKRFRVKF